jgi:hypothetical protein
VGHDLGVGVAVEDVPVLDQLRLEVDPVLDDAVVHHHHVAAAVHVGMGVPGVGGAVGGPPGVPDPGVGLGRALPIDKSLEVGDPPRLLEDGQRPAVIEGDAGRVISPVLEPGQSRHQNIDHGLRPDVSNDSAHIPSLSAPA